MKRFHKVASLAFSLLTLIPSAHAGAKSIQTRTLSFTERVAYQYAIEEVYWRHQIWPKENPQRKPSLDVVISPTQIEKKVEDYLRNSELLADQWHHPITPEQLQAEMDRIASHTKQPDVLGELFAALGNDPCVIAECLARAVLTERLARDLHTQRKLDVRNTNSSIGSSSTMATFVPTRYRLPVVTSVPTTCLDSWTATGDPSPAGVPGRYLHAAIWTGSEMIVWGGNDGPAYVGGGRYNPTTDSWSLVSTIDEPSYRDSPVAVWTGTEMIIWGSTNDASGGRYNPATDSWVATSITNAPEARSNQTGVWTGTEMIIWGGVGTFGYLNDGGRYNPSTDSWTPTSFPWISCDPDPCPLAGRAYPTAVWTGTEMIVWGGEGDDGFLITGGRYNPSTDTWIGTDFTTAPAARLFHTAVWTGTEMIVWGGENEGGVLNTGGRYNPVTNSWADTTIISAPDARVYHTAVWTGSEMIVWGGNETATNTGGRYNPTTDNWTDTTTNDAPEGRFLHTAVWTGTEMIVWGGIDAAGHGVGTGGRYCGQPSTPTLQSAVSRKTHGAAGTFDINLPLTGTAGIECRSTGGTNDYTIVVTFGANVTVTGSPQAQVIVGTGCVGNGGVCSGNVSVSANTVTVPLTNITNAQTISVRINGVNNAGDAPATDFSIPMSILIGDTNANATVNVGDVAQTKARLGQAVDATNFRSDVNANGSINVGDVSIIKAKLGTGLP